MPNMTITTRRSPFELESFNTPSHTNKLLASPIHTSFHSSPPTHSTSFYHDDTELPDESATDINQSFTYHSSPVSSPVTASALPYDATLSGLTYIKSLLATSPSPFATLTVLDISNRYINDDGCALLCSVLPRYPTITTLNLSSNDLHSASATHLASLLSHPHCTLTTLQLDWNALSQPAPLLAALHTNTSVTHLDLRNNRITWEGGAALARCLSGNRTLTLVDMRWNAIGAVGGESLATALVYNNTVQNLLLDGNNITAESRAHCDEALRKNRALAQSTHRDNERHSFSTSERGRREVGFRQMQDELWKATDEIVRLQAEVRDREARMAVLQERMDERDARREREVRDLEGSTTERHELRAELDRLNRLLRTTEQHKQTAEEAARQAKEQAASILEDKQRLDANGRVDDERWRLMVNALRDELSKLRLDVEDRERQVREIEERRRRDEENRNTALHEQLRKAQRECETVKRERDVREEELVARVGAYKREKEAVDERHAKENEQWKTERRAWEDRCVAAEVTARDEERRRREALQNEVQLITASRQELVEAMEAERRERRDEREREREELSSLKVRVIEAERDRERESRACEEKEEEVRRINDTLTGERIERQVALNELMRKHGEELRRLEDRWMKGEEERLRLQRRVDEVERERGRREQVLQSAMSALHVSMQQIDHASHMPTVMHATTAAVAAELMRPATPAITAVVLPLPTATAAVPAAEASAILTSSSLVASQQPNTPIASSAATRPDTAITAEPIPADRPTLPSPKTNLTITVPPHSISTAATATTGTAARQPHTPITPAASSASAILAALRNKPPPAAFNKRTASAPPSQLTYADIEVEVEVEADETDWEREMEAEMNDSESERTSAGSRSGKRVSGSSKAQKKGSVGRKVERVKEEENDVEIEFSEEEVDIEEEVEEKQPMSAVSSRGSKVQTKGGVPHVRRY